jgi:hypothetical protein
MGAMAPAAPEVSVVVPTRNRVDLLRQALSTILGQEDVSLEVVVVDEASADGTAEMLAAASDSRLRVLRNDEPVGPATARNQGAAATRARWVAYCDDDDLWAPDKLRRQLDALRAAPEAGWCSTGDVLVDPSLRVIGHTRPPHGPDLLPLLLKHNTLSAGASGVVVGRDLLAAAGGFDPSMKGGEDWELWIRLAQRSPLTSVDHPLVAYRMWPGARSVDHRFMRQGNQQIRTRYGVTGGSAAAETYMAKQALRGGRRLDAARAYLQMARSRPVVSTGRAVAALVAPTALVRLGDRRAAATVPQDWLAAVEPWLTPHRARPGLAADAPRSPADA